MKEAKSFSIIYGSQTGQAESIAERIYAETCQMGLDPKFFCMNEIHDKFKLGEDNLLVIVVSSTGDGDPPDNAQKFMKKIHDRSLKTNYLSNIQFALLGLGDSNYSTFQGTPKKLEKRLLQLGARKFIDSGTADDQIGLELAVEPWLETLYNSLREYFDFPRDETAPFNPIFQQRTKINDMKDSSLNDGFKETGRIPFLDVEPYKFPKDEPSLIKGSDTIRNQENLRVPVSAQSFIVSSVTHEKFDASSCIWQNGERFPGIHSDPVEVRVVGAVEISKEGIAHKPKRELHLELSKDEKSEELFNEYDAGDSFYFIFPNPKPEVDFILDRLNLLMVADQTCYLSVDSNTSKRNASVPKYIPNPSSIRYIFTYCLDIRRAPGRPMFRVLADYTSDEAEKRRLLELCSAEGVQEFTTHVRQAGISLVDMLIAFPSCSPPVDRLIELLPRLLPRPYSVASYKNKWKRRLRFVYSLLRFPADNGLQYSRFGVCSGWLTTLRIGDKIQIMLKEPSKFRLPPIVKPEMSIKDVPLVLIGPGTGIAPFISFLQKLYDVKTNTRRYVFYGSFNLEEEYIFRDELERLVEKRIITELMICESRVENSLRPTYVQDAIKLKAKDIVDLMTSETEPKPLIFACGDANGMSKDLWKCFKTILQEQLGHSEPEADSFLKNLKQEERYIEDVWS